MNSKELGAPYTARKLLGEAKSDGDIDVSFTIIEPLVDKINPSQDTPETDEVIFAGILIDDSASIEEFGNTKAVIDGHNSVIESLKGSKQREKIRFGTQLMNKGALNNWVPLDDAKPLTGGDGGNYKPDNGTPLYDASVEFLGSALLEKKQAMDSGIPARYGVMIVSDGENTDSKIHKDAGAVKKVVTELFSNNDPDFPNTLTFMGLPNDRVNYKEIAKSMGIEETRINKKKQITIQVLTPDSNPASIRRAFDVFSKSSVRNK